jgi:hypothetical protein
LSYSNLYQAGWFQMQLSMQKLLRIRASSGI